MSNPFISYKLHTELQASNRTVLEKIPLQIPRASHLKNCIGIIDKKFY